MDLNKTRIDTELAKEGVWVPLDGETRLKIAQWLNPHHRKYLQKALDPYKRALRMGTLSDEDSNRIEAEAVAHTVLIDWDNLKDNGVNLEYSKEKATQLLRDPELSWLMDFVREQAENLANFRDEVGAEEIQDVGKPSNLNSIGGAKAKNS